MRKEIRRIIMCGVMVFLMVAAVNSPVLAAGWEDFISLTPEQRTKISSVATSLSEASRDVDLSSVVASVVEERATASSTSRVRTTINTSVSLNITTSNSVQDILSSLASDYSQTEQSSSSNTSSIVSSSVSSNTTQSTPVTAPSNSSTTVADSSVSVTAPEVESSAVASSVDASQEAVIETIPTLIVTAAQQLDAPQTTPIITSMVAAPTGAQSVNGEWVAKAQKNTKIKSVAKGKKSLKATWSKVKGVAGYQVQYSTDKKFKKDTKSVTIKKAKTTSTTVKKLKANKKYFVRIRTFKNVKLTDGTTVKVYSSWSKAKTITVK